MSTSADIESSAPSTGSVHRDVLVVGGGLAGLATARLLQRSGVSVAVIDAHVGGRARSDQVDGFTFNRGPHALYLGGAGEKVLADLGVSWRGGEPLLGGGRVFGDGEIHRLPAAPASMLSCKYLGLRDKASLGKLFAKLPKLKAREWQTRTVSELVDGLTDHARKVALMAVRTATYGNAPDEMSGDTAIVALQAPGVRYIDGGWQSLVDQLAAGVEVIAATAAAVHGGEVVTSGGVFSASTVVVAVGTPAAAAGLLACEPFACGRPIEAACLDLGLSTAPKAPILMGLDEPLYFSTHSPPAQLSADGTFVAHAARYLAATDSLSPAEQRSELEAHAARAGAGADSLVAARYLHRMTVVGAMPIAAQGGLAGRPAIEVTGQPNTFLAGDWVGPDGQLADTAFASASAVAARIGAQLDR